VTDEDHMKYQHAECECVEMDRQEANPHGLSHCGWKPDTEVIPVILHDFDTGKYPTTTGPDRLTFPYESQWR
jgi:hypothetical protein